MRKTNTTKRLIQSWIEEDQYLALEALCAQRSETECRNVTMAELVREAIRKMVNKTGEKK